MKHYLLLTLVSFFISLLCACHTQVQPEIYYSPTSSVTRTETIQIAESYRSMLWTASPENAFHGKDTDGILVNTPDLSLKKGIADRPGWWKTTEENQGMPYMWGGFDTPKSFQEKLERGYYAGDVYTSSKRNLLYDGVSKYATGIDCSGFVSRCWRLDRAYSTRELAGLCQSIDYQDLQMGDLINKRNVHALLFEKWMNPEKTHFMAYETGSAPSWKVLRHVISVNYVKGLGYQAYRYKGIR